MFVIFANTLIDGNIVTEDSLYDVLDILVSSNSGSDIVALAGDFSAPVGIRNGSETCSGGCFALSVQVAVNGDRLLHRLLKLMEQIAGCRPVRM